MPSSLLKMRDDIRQLPFADRVRLVHDLEQDLDNDAAELPDASIDAAWEAEEKNRLEDIISNRTPLMSQADLRRRLDEVRARHTPQ